MPFAFQPAVDALEGSARRYITFRSNVDLAILLIWESKMHDMGEATSREADKVHMRIRLCVHGGLC